MGRLLKRISSCFSAGAVGALAASLLLWSLGTHGVTGSLGVSLAPRLSAQWLYPRIVWGGLWAQLLLLPLARSSFWARGLLVSLFPTAFQLLYFYPMVLRRGYFGLESGELTPLVVFVVNAVWGLVTVLWLRWADRGA
ncbi:MAG: hypothetical protein ACOWWM_00095 [Desulfobacterales bacterium]